MYLKYQLSTTSTVEKVMDDLVRAILPNPDLNLMSAECDKVNSELINTVTSNWELWDRVVTTPGSVAYSVLRSLNADGITYKYMQISFTSATAMTVQVHETWNKTTHVGTNACFNTSYTGGIYPVTLNQSTVFYVFASNNFALLATKNLISGSQYSTNGCIEFSRDDAWNTPALGYPCFAKMVFENASNPNGLAYPIFTLPRIKTPAADVLAGQTAGLQLLTSFYNSPATIANANDPSEFGIARGANFNDFEITISEGKVHKVITGFTPYYYFKGGLLLGGIKFCTPGIGSSGDEITIDNVVYRYDKGLKVSMLLPKR